MINPRYFITPLLVASFLVLGITGLVRFPGLLDFLGINYVSLPMSSIGLVHDWSGLVFLIVALSHIVVNRRGLVRFTVFKFRYLEIIILAALTVSAIFYLENNIFSGVAKLAEKEVREYQGENLSSVNDLRDVSIGGTQDINIDEYRLEISGLVESPQKLTYDEVLNFSKYSKVVEINCVVGWSAKILWEGVLVQDLLEKAVIKPGAQVAIFYARDGFTTSLSLDYIKDNDILLAYKINDVVLPPEKGFPFQLVAEQKWGYKWIKWLDKIEVSGDANYRGTYESAGYSNDADLTGPKREQ